MAAKPFEILVKPQKPLTLEQAARHYGLNKSEAAAVRMAVLRLMDSSKRLRPAGPLLAKRRLATRKK